MAGLVKVYGTERHPLYLACTRARVSLWVSGMTPESDFRLFGAMPVNRFALKTLGNPSLNASVGQAESTPYMETGWEYA